MATKLFVGCLPYSKTENDILQVFTQFGNVIDVAVLHGKGAAFVTYADAGGAVQAIAALQGYVFEGATRGINVNYATPGGGGGQKGQGPKPTRFSQQPTGKGGKGFSPYLGAQKGGAGDGAGTKLFVGRLPYSKSEGDIWQLFSSVGPVVEVALLKNPQTQEKKGAAFVKYQTSAHAAAAVAALDGFVFNGATRPIAVSIHSSMSSAVNKMGTPAGKRSFDAMSGGASAQVEDGAKIFVGQLPFSKSERDLKEVFARFGQIAEVVLHRDANGQKKGAAFVSFYSANSAVQALECDGFQFPGSTRAITVSLVGDGGDKRRRFA